MVENLLPCAKDWRAVADRHRDRGAQRGGLQVGMAVTVVPALLMAVLAAWRHEAIQDVGQVFLQARFELDRADRAGAAHVVYVDKPRLHPGRSHDAAHRVREVVHVAMPTGGQLNLLLVHHSGVME